jgi:hypothetical protein
MGGARRRGRALRGLLALGVLALAACEPSGEGELTAHVQAPRPTGALVIDLIGTGVLGFEGAGDTRTFSGAVDPRATSHRVIVVSTSGQRLTFRVRVEDVSAPPPTAAVSAAADASNVPIETLEGYEVRIAR